MTTATTTIKHNKHKYKYKASRATRIEIRSVARNVNQANDKHLTTYLFILEYGSVLFYLCKHLMMHVSSL